MREAVMASQPQDPNAVARHILGPVPGEKTVWYQKHMSHHMVDGFPLDWMDDVTNVFLLRAPELFLNLGERVGVISHISSYWRYRFPEGEAVTAYVEEAIDIFTDFEAGLSTPLPH